jgi:hypothetical protein
MTLSITLLRWVLRIGFLIAIALGLALWSGRGYAYVQPHMWIGFILTFDLLFLVILSLLARVRLALPLFTLVWAIALPVLGIAQTRIMAGASHWLIQVVHLILGLGAIGLGEALCKRTLLAIQAR